MGKRSKLESYNDDNNRMDGRNDKRVWQRQNHILTIDEMARGGPKNKASIAF